VEKKRICEVTKKLFGEEHSGIEFLLEGYRQFNEAQDSARKIWKLLRNSRENPEAQILAKKILKLLSTSRENLDRGLLRMLEKEEK
jgi:predicted metal-dependent hydrolase